MHLGKKVRLERIMNRNTGTTIIVPCDHGVTVGPLTGLENMQTTVNKIAEGGGNAVLMHKGLVRASHRSSGKDLGLIVHLSASTALCEDPNKKILVASVEDALKLGADAVSLHVNLGSNTEGQMLADFGKIATSADSWGMPILAMVYGRGPNIKNEYDPCLVAHTARVGAELGADIVKVAYTGDIDSFARVVESCPIPVVIAGGPKLNSAGDFLQMVHDAMIAGAKGLSVGRNVFQHDDIQNMVRVLGGMVHERWSVEKGCKELNVALPK